MANETIFEPYMLPSRGKIYDKEINPLVELTSMKVWQEMKRLSPTDMPYKMMCDIIEECLKDKPEISVYDMCFGDYQFLLYKLRTVTYGSKYKVNMTCPKCGSYEEVTFDLDELEEFSYEENIEDLKHIKLPKSGDEIELTFQTPRKLDEITRKAKEMQKKLKTNTDFTLLFTLMSVIKKVNGNEMSTVMLENYCKNLNMQDTQAIIQGADKFNDKVGISNYAFVSCPNCGEVVKIPFRIFLGPIV